MTHDVSILVPILLTEPLPKFKETLAEYRRRREPRAVFEAYQVLLVTWKATIGLNDVPDFVTDVKAKAKLLWAELLSMRPAVEAAHAKVQPKSPTFHLLKHFFDTIREDQPLPLPPYVDLLINTFYGLTGNIDNDRREKQKRRAAWLTWAKTYFFGNDVKTLLSTLALIGAIYGAANWLYSFAASIAVTSATASPRTAPASMPASASTQISEEERQDAVADMERIGRQTDARKRETPGTATAPTTLLPNHGVPRLPQDRRGFEADIHANHSETTNRK